MSTVRKMLYSPIYKMVMKCREAVWRMRGGRRAMVFGQDCRFVPETDFLRSFRLRLPRERWDAGIVGYADYVQFHAVMSYVAGLERPPFVVDVGAYHGAYAIVLGKLVAERGGKLMAVEPNPKAFALLKKNVALNSLDDVVLCVQAAISDSGGRLLISDRGSQSAIGSAGEDAVHSVEAATLRELLSRGGFDRVDLLIVDVEGAELPVLRGFPWGETGIGRIFCELHPYAWKEHGYGAGEMAGFLEERNFRALDMYLNEHVIFEREGYIGPVLLLPRREAG